MRRTKHHQSETARSLPSHGKKLFTPSCSQSAQGLKPGLCLSVSLLDNSVGSDPEHKKSRHYQFSSPKRRFAFTHCGSSMAGTQQSKIPVVRAQVIPGCHSIKLVC